LQLDLLKLAASNGTLAIDVGSVSKQPGNSNRYPDGPPIAPKFGQETWANAAEAWRGRISGISAARTTVPHSKGSLYSARSRSNGESNAIPKASQYRHRRIPSLERERYAAPAGRYLGAAGGLPINRPKIAGLVLLDRLVD